MRRESTEHRLERIHRAVRKLIERRDISDISIYDVAKEASIATSTVYHHYRNISELFDFLMSSVFSDFEKVLYSSIDETKINHWSDINRMIEEGFVRYYREDLLVQKLLLSQHTFSSIRHADVENDAYLGILVDGIYRKYFNIPSQPQHVNIFTVALQLADKVYSLNYRNNGSIDADMAEEAIKVTQSYLSLYLPHCIPKNSYELLLEDTV
ncbi:TetR/AcrR family transcriptional regulator [Photobacterium damselae]|uniref:TetR/AcrR family transcriptional regulator n=1 Tax=Photobacterium damselae subsp. damselae TaxID=85581 RepID=A0AAD3WSY8_PHODD|nr:TetR/AcrR family transcriptional regulator [Photobacterium damselae]KAB1176179.1 TetR/AcrR family transcriptional regulator [Photobacterium damselae subsp. damselae]